MLSPDRLRAEFGAAVQGAAGLEMADRLCNACMDLLEVDGAAISLMQGESTDGTFGSSNELSRRLDGFQFTFGEGPCIDSVREAIPILVPDLQDAREQRWPTYAAAVLDAGVRAVYALPVALSRTYVGALDLFRAGPAELTGADLSGGLLAAQLAALPLLHLISGAGAVNGPEEDGWSQLASLDGVEVHQATGMIMGQLNVGPTEALVRLRTHAFSHGLTASELSWQIVNRQVRLQPDDPWHGATGPAAGPA